MNLVEGWNISNTENGYTLTAQFYSICMETPLRGTHPPALPNGFESYVISQVETSPLTQNGPYLISITARPYLDYNGVKSLCWQHKSSRESRQYKVKRSQLNSWPNEFDNRRKEIYTFDFAVLDFYVVSTDLSGVKNGILSDIPSWSGLPSGNCRWRLFSKKVEKVYDNDGITPLKHITAELIGIPSGLSTKWSTLRYNTISYLDL